MTAKGHVSIMVIDYILKDILEKSSNLLPTTRDILSSRRVNILRLRTPFVWMFSSEKNLEGDVSNVFMIIDVN